MYLQMTKATTTLSSEMLSPRKQAQTSVFRVSLIPYSQVVVFLLTFQDLWVKLDSTVAISSINQVSIFFRAADKTEQYYFQDVVRFFIKANAEIDNILNVASTLCIAYQDNEFLLEVVNGTASSLH